MDEWEAKYKALAAGIEDPKLIENAEKLVNISSYISVRTPLPFGIVLQSMLHTIQVLRDKPTKPKELFGFPVSLQEWMPTHYAAVGNSENIVITDLRSGEIRRVTKDVMERVVSEFFAEEKE